MPTCKFTKKTLSHIILQFAFIFKNVSRLLLPKRLLKCASKISFRKYKQRVVLLVIYLFNNDSCKSTSFMLNVVFDCLEYGFCQVSWNLLQYITKITKTFFFSRPVFWYAVLFDKKLIILHHGDNTFLFYFDICIKQKKQELSPSLRHWLSRQQILFYSWIWYLSLTIATVFVPDSFESTSWTSEAAAGAVLQKKV